MGLSWYNGIFICWKTCKTFKGWFPYAFTKKSDLSKLNTNKKKQKKKVEAKVEEKKEYGIAIAAYLNLVADFAHNFTDGLAIGASFLTGHGIGVIKTIKIFWQYQCQYHY